MSTISEGQLIVRRAKMTMPTRTALPIHLTNPPDQKCTSVESAYKECHLVSSMNIHTVQYQLLHWSWWRFYMMREFQKYFAGLIELW